MEPQTPQTQPTAKKCGACNCTLTMPKAVLLCGLFIGIGLALGLSLGGNRAPRAVAPDAGQQPSSIEEVTAELAKLAKKEAGVRESDFNACMDSDRHLEKIARLEAPGANQGTPFSIIVGPDQTLAVGGALPYEIFEEVVIRMASGETFEVPADMADFIYSVEGIELDEADHIRGSVDAPVRVFEFSDIDCPFCARVHPTMIQLVENHPDKVAWVYRHHPLPIHPMALTKAEATECVAELGGEDAFWNYLDTLFS